MRKYIHNNLLKFLLTANFLSETYIVILRKPLPLQIITNEQLDEKFKLQLQIVQRYLMSKVVMLINYIILGKFKRF